MKPKNLAQIASGLAQIALVLALIESAAYAGPITVAAGATSQCFDVVAKDSTSTTGGAKTGLAYNTSSLTCYYYRQNAGTGGTSITLATSTLGTYTSGAFKEIDATNMPGHYEFCPPNAALASAAGVNWVSFSCKGATGMVPIDLDVALINPNTFGYDGALAAKSGKTLTLAIGAVPANNSFAYQDEVVFFSSTGLVKANSCVVSSTAASNQVVTADDISSYISTSDNYVIRPNAACYKKPIYRRD
jgi:hypothetical protein